MDQSVPCAGVIEQNEIGDPEIVAFAPFFPERMRPNYHPENRFSES
jgi:hypothetical protein